MDFYSKKNKIILFSLAIIMAIALSYCFYNFNTRNISAQSSSDAIAIRIIPNSNHYSAMRWYREKGFSGSPQSTLVDGYRAVRDGRTVYVNVANINSGNLYTNIYLISYNQDAEQATKDIFSKILSHWKFNTNITGQGYCREDPEIFCLKDEDCPIGDFCDSPKARITRDVRRMADLAEVKVLIGDYYEDNSFYPKLEAGTYLPNRTVSVWPSWKDEFSDVAGSTLSPDPINRLGDCPGYNETTCWDEYTKSFAVTLPNLPNNSLAYTYMSSSDGSSATYCAVFESGMTLEGAPTCELNVCLDFDNDGYGNPASSDCPNSGLDCNDNDPYVQSGSPENCSDLTDNDCDGLTDCDDGDCAGSGACSGSTCVPNGCNGSCPFGCSETEDPDCGCLDSNGCCGFGCGSEDNDCPPSCSPDGCNNNCPPGCNVTQDPDCDCVNSNACCGFDCNYSNDKDCSEVCTDGDGDGYDLFNSTLCPSGDDCNDSAAGINPGASEVCNGIDDDCNPGTPDGSGETAPLNDIQTGECAGNKACMGAAGWQDSYKATYETVESSCADGLDNDCNGSIDCADPNCASSPSCGPACGTNGCEAGENCNNCPADCGICCGNSTCEAAYGENCNTCSADCGICCGNGACEAVYGENCSSCAADCGVCPPLCADGDGDGVDACDGSGLPITGCDNPCDCNDSANWIFPGAAETCDTYDNNCNTQTDEGCDDDTDGYCDAGMILYNNSSMCTQTIFTGNGMSGDDCNDILNTINPGATEVCNNIDDDCDPGTADGSDEVPGPNPLNLGVCAGTNQACVAGVWQASYPGTYQITETSCSDGLDNDCDGLPDCLDPDCECNCIFTLTLPCDFL